MRLDTIKKTVNGKTYTSHLLRHAYRDNGRVRHRTIANLSRCSSQEIEAIRFALKQKGGIQQWPAGSDDVRIQQGLSIGALFTVSTVARRLGIVQALGNSQHAKQALWQVIARVLDQGSRLSAVRLASSHAACDVLGLQSFDENDLYLNLDWLCTEQASIEDRLYRTSRVDGKSQLFLDDVTSSYLEGPQIEAIHAEKWTMHQITAITKPQIESLLKSGLFQTDLFDETLAEVTDEATSVRYVLRRNPHRADELTASRQEKSRVVEKMLSEQNKYLVEHPRAGIKAAVARLKARISKSRLSTWLTASSKKRTLSLSRDEDALNEVAKLDGCYCLKTDLTPKMADKELVLARYKSLSQVEWAFRTCKTSHLEMRPVFVRKESRTRGHALVVMLAYRIEMELRRSWTSLNVTVAEGLAELSSLCMNEVTILDLPTLNQIPEPRPSVQNLLNAADIKIPDALPYSGTKVDTKKTG